MSLSGAAAAMGLPEALVQRSAEARAAETGDSVESILAAWAGGEAVSSAPPAEAEPESTPSEEPEATSVVPEPQVVQEVTVTDPQPVAAAQAPTRAPVPSEVTVSEAAHLPDVVTVPTAGIRERTNFSMPSWLTALLIIAPLFALFALGGSATGTCGEATELGVDVITGEIVNCDGSEFTGSQIGGGGGTDFVAAGSEIYAAQCAGCHGPNGAGVGNFPALTGVMTTFGACADHLEWVALGSAGFQAEGRNSYGDTGKSIGGGMPGFGSSLSEEQLAAVVAFERVRFGGADEAEVGIDCGITEPADGDGEGGEGEEDDGTGEGTDGEGGEETETP